MIPTPLPRCTPEAQGISSHAVTAFLTAAHETIDELHSFMLLRRGQVVAEAWWKPYTPERAHMLFSLSKSFTSTAVGLAAAEGRLALDDAVISFFPRDLPRKVSPNLAAMRVRHLLTMTAGQSEDTVMRMAVGKSKNWARAFLALPVEHEPGTQFVYNSGASYMLSAIIQQVSGQTLLDYLRPRLFEPLGILNPAWETCPRGINTGGWGLSITSEDIARFGLLYQQDGMWNGQRLLPEAWVREATRKQVPNAGNKEPDWKQGYGYQFWRCRHNAYRGDGAFGQNCVVMPDQQAVLVTTAGVDKMQPVLDLVWKHLLPAMGSRPLPEDVKANAALQQVKKQLFFSPPQGKASSPLTQVVSAKPYHIEPNPVMVSQLSFDFTPSECRVSMLQGKRRRHTFACGYGNWIEGQTTLTSRQPRAIAASGVWAAEDTFVMTVRYLETPFTQKVTCLFEDDRVQLSQVLNLSLGPREGPTLTGKAAA